MEFEIVEVYTTKKARKYASEKFRVGKNCESINHYRGSTGKQFFVVDFFDGHPDPRGGHILEDVEVCCYMSRQQGMDRESISKSGN